MKLDWLANNPSDPLTAPPQCYNYRLTGLLLYSQYFFFLTLVLEIKSRSSCFNNKLFTVWSVPSVLSSCLTVPVLQRCLTEVSHHGYLCPSHVNVSEQCLKCHWLFGCLPSFMGCLLLNFPSPLKSV